MQSAIKDGLIEFVLKDDSYVAYEKIYKPLEGSNTKKYSTWFDSIATNAEGSKELKTMLDKKIFDFPKPINLLDVLLKIANCDSNSIILDCFAGSGTTAHAVINLNTQADTNCSTFYFAPRSQVHPPSDFGSTDNLKDFFDNNSLKKTNFTDLKTN